MDLQLDLQLALQLDPQFDLPLDLQSGVGYRFGKYGEISLDKVFTPTGLKKFQFFCSVKTIVYPRKSAQNFPRTGCDWGSIFGFIYDL